MIAIRELPVRRLPLPMADPTQAGERAARDLARAYSRYASALWRGDAHGTALGPWLSAYWCDRLPQMPRRPPDAVSPHGAGGRGIRWYGSGAVVLGYVPGASGGYRIPRESHCPTA